MDDCPKCHSPDWRLASILYNQGITGVDERENGSSLGVGAGTGGMGAAYARHSSNTHGTHQTQFSKKLMPPEIIPKPEPPKKPEKETREEYKRTGKLILIFLLIWGGSTIIFINLFWGVIITAIPIFFRRRILEQFDSEDAYLEYEKRHQRSLLKYEKQMNAYEKKEEEYNQSVKNHHDWERAQVCMRCGTIFLDNRIIKNI